MKRCGLGDSSDRGDLREVLYLIPGLAVGSQSRYFWSAHP